MREQRAQTALEPTGLDQAYWLAGQLAASGLFGKSLAQPAAVLAVVMTGRELGLTAMQSVRGIHVIDGKPTLSADLMVALCKRSPLCKRFRVVKSDATIATYETERLDEGRTEMSFTIEEAKQAGLLSKANWKGYPAAMLRARCAAALARAVYPDLMVGLYDPDEIVEGGGVAYQQPETITVEERATPPRVEEAAPHTGPIVEGEVVPVGTPAIATATDSAPPWEQAPTLLEQLVARMKASITEQELEEVADDIGRALKAGTVPADRKEELNQVYEEQLVRLGGVG